MKAEWLGGRGELGKYCEVPAAPTVKPHPTPSPFIRIETQRRIRKEHRLDQKPHGLKSCPVTRVQTWTQLTTLLSPGGPGPHSQALWNKQARSSLSPCLHVAARARLLSVVFSPTPQLPALHCNSFCETIPDLLPQWLSSPWPLLVLFILPNHLHAGASFPWPLGGPSSHLLLLCALPGLNLDVGAQLPCAIGFDSFPHSSGNDSAFRSLGPEASGS